MKRTLKKVALFFDDSDPQNKGYAYRAHYSDGHVDSGEYNELSATITPSAAELLHHCEAIAKDLGAIDCQTIFCRLTQTTTTTTI